MEAWEWAALAAGIAAVLLVLAIVVALVQRRRRRSQLKERFGSEYDAAVAREGTGGAAKQLSEVEQEHENLSLRTLPEATRERYLEEWRQVEVRFVSDPREAVRSAEHLVERALEERGYPSDADAERRAALVAVEHPDVAERYRHGHSLVETKDDGDSTDSTESLRVAMTDFRAVLEDVVGDRQAA
jgi:hypothetical protein